MSFGQFAAYVVAAGALLVFLLLVALATIGILRLIF